LRLLGGGAGAGALLAKTAHPAWAADATPTPPATPADSLFYGLGNATPVVFASGASVQFARASDFPALAGLSLALFEVALETTREMHWHNNASELGWCLSGSGQMVVLDDDGAPVSFAIVPESVFFAPRGLPHAFWTTGDEPLRILLGFDHPQPTTIDFSQMMPPLPTTVVAQVAGVAETAVPAFPTVAKPFAVPIAEMPEVRASPGANRFTVGIGNVAKESYPGGTRGRVTPEDILTLTGIKTTLITLSPGATREPHWHQAMNETCFLLEGEAEVGIVGPNGESQVALLTPGDRDLAFVPMNWLHYLRNVGDTSARAILFHDATTSRAVELSWTLAGFPAPILAASYGMDPAELEALAGGEAPLIAAPPS
jgi:oxalate decarboxylase